MISRGFNTKNLTTEGSERRGNGPDSACRRERCALSGVIVEVTRENRQTRRRVSGHRCTQIHTDKTAEDDGCEKREIASPPISAASAGSTAAPCAPLAVLSPGPRLAGSPRMARHIVIQEYNDLAQSGNFWVMVLVPFGTDRKCRKAWFCRARNCQRRCGGCAISALAVPPAISAYRDTQSRGCRAASFRCVARFSSRAKGRSGPARSSQSPRFQACSCYEQDLNKRDFEQKLTKETKKRNPAGFSGSINHTRDLRSAGPFARLLARTDKYGRVFSHRCTQMHTDRIAEDDGCEKREIVSAPISAARTARRAAAACPSHAAHRIRFTFPQHLSTFIIFIRG